LLRLVLGMERRVTQTRVGWDAELLKLVRTWVYSGPRMKSSYLSGQEVHVLV